MHPSADGLDALGVAWRLGATFFFVVLNGFFVAAEFALVKTRAERAQELAIDGSQAARSVHHMMQRLDLYLSACQLGITLASLALGALGEPAVSRLIIALAGSMGVNVDAESQWLHIVSLLLAFTVITVLHMTLGEQAPKMLALRRPERTALGTASMLRVFAFVFRPFITLINSISNGMLRLAGLPATDHGQAALSAEEIRSVLSLSARSGEISKLEHEIAENVFRLIDLEARHIMVPRVDVKYLSLSRTLDENLRLLRDCGHSRFPLCDGDLDSMVGLIHGKDVLEKVLSKEEIDLRALARKPLIVPDTMALSDVLLEFQTHRIHLAAVVDEHGTIVGLAFREDALEEIVGPLGDEFDGELPELRELEPGVWEARGDIAFPDICARLDEVGDDEGEETLRGYMVARLGRLPRAGDTTRLGRYKLSVSELDGHRIARIRIEAAPAAEDVEDNVTPEGFGAGE